MSRIHLFLLQVHSFAKLNTEFKLHDTFIACGRELVPFELKGGYDLTDELPRFPKMRKPRRNMDGDRFERFGKFRGSLTMRRHVTCLLPGAPSDEAEQPRSVGMERALVRPNDPALSQFARPAMRPKMAPKGMAPKVPAPLTNGEPRNGEKMLSPDWMYPFFLLRWR